MYNTNINTAHAESSAVDYSPHISRYLCVQQHNCRWTRVVGSPVITGDDGCPYYFSAVVVSWLATAIFTSALIHRERERERERKYKRRNRHLFQDANAYATLRRQTGEWQRMLHGSISKTYAISIVIIRRTGT